MANQVELLTGLVNVAIPEVYQKGMSYYEVLTAVVNKVNELIEQSNEYFSEDVLTVVDSVLTKWKDDGTLDTVINNALIPVGNRTYTNNNYVVDLETITASVDNLDTKIYNDISAVKKLKSNVYNAVEYGADNTGVVNATSVIQDLINTVPAGSTIYFNSGLYVLNQITINKSLNFKGDVGATLKLADNANTSFIVTDINISNVNIEGLILDGNKLNNTIVPETVLLGFANNNVNFSVSNCTIKNAYGKGIGTGHNCSQFNISNNFFMDNKEQHMNPWNGAHTFVINNNVITGGNHAGIMIDGDINACYDFTINNNVIDLEGSTAYDCIILRGIVEKGNIIGNICENGRNGIYLLNNPNYVPTAKNIIIKGNNCNGHSQNGIIAASAVSCIIVGNICTNNGSAGINMTKISTAPVPSDNIIMCNRCDNNAYGLIDGTGTLRSTIIGNNVKNNTTIMFDDGIEAVVKDNIGFKTENNGVAIVAAGTTSIVVTHGCDFAPNYSEIFVVPFTSLTTASYFWLTNPNATTFTINVNVAPSSGIYFAWLLRGM